MGLLWLVSCAWAGVIAVAGGTTVSGCRCGSAEAGAFGGGPDGQEPVNGGGVADQSDGDAPGPADDHGGGQDDRGEEAAELHPEVGAPVALAVHHQREPGLDVPGQGRADHVGPVGDQVVQRYPQGVDAGLELGDDVLLVTAFVREVDDLCGGLLAEGGDVE